jgi:hypothetical protein
MEIMETPLKQKSSIEEIRKRFNDDVERFSNIESSWRAPGVGPREVFDISRNTIKLSLENGAILPFLKAKRAFF